MKSIWLSWKFISRKETSASRSWSVIVPILGVALGTAVVTLTFAVMDGMEKEVFANLRNFTAPARIILNDPAPGLVDRIEDKLTQESVGHFRTIERNGIIKITDQFRVVKFRAITNLDRFLQQNFGFVSNPVPDQGTHNVVIGSELAQRLNVVRNIQVQLISPLDVNLMTGRPPQVSAMVTNVFAFDLVDMDLNFAFIPYATGVVLFKQTGRIEVLLDQELTADLWTELGQEYPNIGYRLWIDEYQELVSAMRLEKIAYSIFGFMIVFISCFNLLSVLSMAVMRKIPQIGMLKAMGYNPRRIARIFVLQATVTGLVGTGLGISLAAGAVYVERTWHLLRSRLTNFPIMEFPLLLSPVKIGLVVSVTLLLVLVASAYPAWKAAKLNPIRSINFIK